MLTPRNGGYLGDGDETRSEALVEDIDAAADVSLIVETRSPN
jgi:hypothetical protein